MSSDDQDSATTLAQLLRRHGFFETLTEEAIPLVSHLFSDFCNLKATIAQFKSELIDLKEASTFQQKLLQPLQQDNKALLQENNQLRFRVVELEDFTKDASIKFKPPVPEPFPMRAPVTVNAENLAMEMETDQLRKYVQEINIKDQKLKEENEKLRAELQFNVQLNDQLTKKLKDIQVQIPSATTRGKKDGVRDSRVGTPNQQNASTVGMIPVQSSQVNEREISSISRSSLVSDRQIQQDDKNIQTDERQCFQCSIYSEQIQHLNKQLTASKNQQTVSTVFQTQLQTQQSNVLQLQQQLDFKTRTIQDLQAEVENYKQLHNGLQNINAENETTVLTAHIIQQKLEQKLQQQIQISLDLKTTVQQYKETINDLQQQIGEQTHSKIKAEKTAHKLAIMVDELQAKIKLNDGVIQRLDKANQTMSQYLSRLSLENQRLKQITGEE
ncbi:Conserved_hypothetical protein [Hexamita inflata]|uniref:Uncharacterized protein n=1 Tax=Hexamita inflata TaxID=28002 RepID=A0AA86PIQ6_9EUKA|nr:Conserved hypothetical protein [Hexamita inflata]